MRTLFFVLLAAFAFFNAGCNYGLVKVPTGAMEPTIPLDSYVLWEKTTSLTTGDIERFDLVMHTLPPDESRKKLGIPNDSRFIFRVVGLSGEKVEVKNGQMFVNDQKLEEPFKKIASTDDFGPIVIPPDEFFLLGDNRPESNDSRFWKPATVPIDRIDGKVSKVF